MTDPGSPGHPAVARRRRGATLEDAILDAAWRELMDVGYANLTIGAVAGRARTSKPVLYRRWPRRADLILAAMLRHAPLLPGPLPDTGTLRGDVLALLGRVSAGVEEIGLANIFGIAADSIRDEADVSLMHGMAAATQAMAAILQRAASRGETRAGLAVTDRIASLPVALARHELFFVRSGPVPDASLAEIVDQLFLPLVRR